MRKKGIKIVVQKIENKRTQWSGLEHKEGEPNQAERKAISRLRRWRLGLFATFLYTDGTRAQRPGGFSGPPTGAGWALKLHISTRGKIDSWRISNSSLTSSVLTDKRLPRWGCCFLLMATQHPLLLGPILPRTFRDTPASRPALWWSWPGGMFHPGSFIGHLYRQLCYISRNTSFYFFQRRQNMRFF